MKLAALLIAAHISFIGGARAGDRERPLEVGLTGATYLNPTRVTRRQNAPPDYEIWEFSHLGRTYMTAVFGHAPRFPTGAAGRRKGKETRINGVAARDIVFSREGLRFREVLFDFDDEAFPSNAHFYYHALEPEDAARADKIISTIRRL